MFFKNESRRCEFGTMISNNFSSVALISDDHFSASRSASMFFLRKNKCFRGARELAWGEVLRVQFKFLLIVGFQHVNCFFARAPVSNK